MPRSRFAEWTALHPKEWESYSAVLASKKSVFDSSPNHFEQFESKSFVLLPACLRSGFDFIVIVSG
jgi:hypothetical protein